MTASCFDYNGFDEETLLSLCSPSRVSRGIVPWKYWPSEIYSFGRHYRSYGRYPSFLPIYCYSSHGVYDTKAYPHEVENDSYAMLCVSPAIIDAYKENCDKPCYCVPSPFVWYRKKNRIEKSSSAKGTLAFATHSTPDVDAVMDYEAYADMLLSLPKDFFPITVCLHMHDIDKGLHKIFLQKDIPVYTAGHAEDVRFAQRWYEIVRHFSYTTSNMFGSHVFYSVEMGIPFFLMGDRSTWVNHGNKNIPLGELHMDKDHLPAEALFTERVDQVTPEQRAFVEKHLGIHDGLSRKEFSKLLYTAWFRKANIAKDLYELVKYQAKNMARPAYHRAKNAWAAFRSRVNNQ